MHRSYNDRYDEFDERAFELSFQNYPHGLNHQAAQHSPNRAASGASRGSAEEYDEFNDPEVMLRLKWMDNSPRMSRLREHRQKRLINKLEQFELWDIEQEQKQKQYELAREQRYKNIVERLKSQEFCVNLMKKRHESDLETTRELETYSNDHIYFDALDDPTTQHQGPVTQYRKFQTEMDDKLKHLQNDLDALNPRYRIEQAILPRLERTRDLYSAEPDTYTYRGRRVFSKKNNLKAATPSLSENNGNESTQSSSSILSSISSRNYINPSLLGRSSSIRSKDYSSDLYSTDKLRIKPIILGGSSYHDDSARSLSKLKLSGGESKKMVNFNDDIEYRNASSSTTAYDKYRHRTQIY